MTGIKILYFYADFKIVKYTSDKMILKDVVAETLENRRFRNI